MPIYEYACGVCGTQLEVLQKLSDPALTTCPKCGAGEFRKKVSAAGFRLKGGGWYATDFKNQGKPAAKPEAASGDASGDGRAGAGKAEPSSVPASAASVSGGDAKPATATD